MANKSVHQEFNPDAIKYFNINCDPYGVMVDREGTLIKTVYVDKSILTYNTLKKILNGFRLVNQNLMIVSILERVK